MLHISFCFPVRLLLPGERILHLFTLFLVGIQEIDVCYCVFPRKPARHIDQNPGEDRYGNRHAETEAENPARVSAGEESRDKSRHIDTGKQDDCHDCDDPFCVPGRLHFLRFGFLTSGFTGSG